MIYASWHLNRGRNKNCADDIALLLTGLLRFLPMVLHLFAVVGCATFLLLVPCKAAIFPLRTTSLARAASDVRRSDVRAAAFSFVSASRSGGLAHGARLQLGRCHAQAERGRLCSGRLAVRARRCIRPSPSASSGPVVRPAPHALRRSRLAPWRGHSQPHMGPFARVPDFARVAPRRPASAVSIARRSVLASVAASRVPRGPRRLRRGRGLLGRLAPVVGCCLGFGVEFPSYGASCSSSSTRLRPVCRCFSLQVTPRGLGLRMPCSRASRGEGFSQPSALVYALSSDPSLRPTASTSARKAVEDVISPPRASGVMRSRQLRRLSWV